MTTHIDQLQEWWDNAEEGVAKAGDLVVGHDGDLGPGYVVYTIGYDQTCRNDAIRILSRAPKPRPAWHDAVAILATADTPDGDLITGVWVRYCTTDHWESAQDGLLIHGDSLRNVTPLIEARVTDEMCDRLRDHYRTEHQLELPRDNEWLNDLLAAALGLDPDKGNA